jgi:endonuclease/exonuclease/phosphatase family metal-dependent hydrolase
MNRLVHNLGALAIAALTSWSCSTTPPRSESVLKPEITIRVASIDLARVRKRIDKKDILSLAQIVKNEGIEVLAVQNISRYPGMTSRVDFVDELSARSDMRNVFGEMINNSGRQTGNAIFSLYPILTNRNQSFEKIKSASFEAALEAVVDAGVQSLSVVSTQFPDKASKDDQERCLKLILDMNPNPEKHPMIIAGNLPPAMKATSSFEEVEAPEMKSMAGSLWFCSRRTLRILNSNTVETDLGRIAVARFGLYRQ